MDPNENKERERQVKEAIKSYDDIFGDLDMDKSYEPLFELLWHSQLPCMDVQGITSTAKDELAFIKSCYWKNQPISCNSIFQKRPTDRGMCCSFNIDKADNILKESKYTKSISLRQEEEARKGFETDKKPLWYIKNHEPTAEGGKNKGLAVLVDAHSDQLSPATVTDNSRGFVTIIEDRNAYPMASFSSLMARPGYESNIKLSAIHVQAHKEIKEYEPAKRNCYFPDEYELEMHQSYSQSNCILECVVKFASSCITTCTESGNYCNCSNESMEKTDDDDKCVPWFYPVQDEHVRKMCSPWATKAFISIINEHVPKDECKHCLPDCTKTKLDSSISHSEFQKCDHTNIGSSRLCDLMNEGLNPAPWTSMAQAEFENANQSIPLYLRTNMNSVSEKQPNVKRFSNKRSKILGSHVEEHLLFPSEVRENPTYDAFEKDIGIINVFFGDKHIVSYVKKNRMTIYDFLSQIGGSIGLAMGISIISCVEIIYWFTFRLFKNYAGRG